MKYKDITHSELSQYIKKKRKFLGSIGSYNSRDSFDKLIESLGIFKVVDKGTHRDIKILDNSFFDSYHSYYKHLYEPKNYFIWYKLFFTKTLKKDSSKRYNKTKSKLIKDRDGNRCVVCGSSYKLTIDHIEPFFISGDTSYYNLATLCFECNQQKGNTVIPGFIERFILSH